MAYATPIYLDYDEVKRRLTNKVIIDSSDDYEGLATDIAKDIIAQAETEVEEDLRVWYTVPFVTTDGQPWADLPRHTRLQLKNLLLWKAQYRLLEAGFIKQDPERFQEYKDTLFEDYEIYFKKNFTILDGVFIRNPLEGLKQIANNVSNQRLGGMKISPKSNLSLSYAIRQVTDPSRNRNLGIFGYRRYF